MGQRAMFTVTVAVVAALALLAGRASAAYPNVTIFGDSILTAVQGNQEPMDILGDGLAVRMEVGVCRTLVGESCPYEGKRVSTLVERVHEMQIGNEIPPDVVVEVGYNDPADTFADAVEQSLAALEQAGAKRILWVLLKEHDGQYAAMNQVLRDAAARHPELRLADWNAYSAGHEGDWFQNDTKHLLYPGAVALAKLIHQGVLDMRNAPAPPPPPPVTRSSSVALSVRPLPKARVGRKYATRLVASGGAAPYSFRIASRGFPAGLHLLRDGQIYGTPRRAGTTEFDLAVTDAQGNRVTVHEAIAVVRAKRAT